MSEYHPPRKRGRPAKNFSENSSTQKYEKAKKLADSADNNIEMLEYALKLAKIRNNVPTKEEVTKPSLAKHTPESGLAHFIDMGYTKEKYALFKRDQRALGLEKIYPSFRKIQEAKKLCIVPFQKHTEDEIVFSLQEMLNHTIKRLVEGLQLKEHSSLRLYATCGFDSASGYKNPNQAYTQQSDQATSSNQPANSFQSLFFTGLSTIAIESAEHNNILWLNPTPQSIRFCRPLRLSFEKEDFTATVTEKDRLKSAIRALEPYTFTYEENEITVNYNVELTMLDQKCVNFCNGNKDTQKCPICLVRQTHFRGRTAFPVVNESSLKYGLGLLHCHLKAFGLCLALSYRQATTGWAVRKHEKESK